MENSELRKLLKNLGGGYAPLKYYRGLTPSEVKKRYKGAWRETDKGKKTRTSSYTAAFRREFPDAKSLKDKARVTGIPLKIIKEVYDRGLAAWRTGHRPGASQFAWGHARVHSFIMKGCTYYSADKDLQEEAKKKMKPSDKAKWTRREKKCLKKYAN